MTGDTSEFKRNLLCKSTILRRRHLVTCWRHINQSTDDTRLGVRNLHRFVGSHDEESLESVGVGRAELLIDGHHLVRHQTVDAGVILNAREIAIMLNCHQRVRSERLQCKCIAGGAKVFGVEAGVVPIKELLNDIDDSALTGSNCTIEHHKLLKFLGIASYNGSDTPLNFVALLGRI